MDCRHPIGSHRGPSAIRALTGVGKTTTFYVVVFLFGIISDYLLETNHGWI
jgi:hypothetical protein